MRVIPTNRRMPVIDSKYALVQHDDKKSRKALYKKLGKTPDESVDWEAVAGYFKDIL